MALHLIRLRRKKAEAGLKTIRAVLQKGEGLYLCLLAGNAALYAGLFLWLLAL